MSSSGSSSAITTEDLLRQRCDWPESPDQHMKAVDWSPMPDRFMDEDAPSELDIWELRQQAADLKTADVKPEAPGAAVTNGESENPYIHDDE